jgi:WD40 repeat protein
MRCRLLFVTFWTLLAGLSVLHAEPPRLQVQHDSPLACLAWSPEGQWIATATKNGNIRLLEAAKGKEIRSFATGPAIVSIAFSPNGKTLAVNQDGQSISTWEIASGKKQEVFTFNNNKAERLAFSPDGQSIVAVAFGEFMQWRLTGAFSTTKTTKLTESGFAAIAPDGTIGGWSDAKGNVRLRQFDPVRSPTLQVGAATCIAFSAGAKLLAVGGDDSSVRLWDLPSKKQIAVLTGLARAAAKLSLSGNAKTVAALAAGGTSIRVWDVDRKTTRRHIDHNFGPTNSLELSPDGKTLATVGMDDKALLLWNVATREVTFKGPPLKLTAAELKGLWTDLAGPDSQKGDHAWHQLAAAGDHAIPFLRQQIRPVAIPPGDITKIEKLVAELDADKFTARDKASKELLAAGEMAIVPLRRLLERRPSTEALARANLLLKKLGEPALTPDRMRVLEAIELLEQLRTDQAIKLLEEIQRDALVAQIHSEASQALQRVVQSPGQKK